MARRKTKKKKKKRSVSKAPAKENPVHLSDDEADGLVTEPIKTSGCSICRSEAATESVRALLRSMIRKRVYRYQIRTMLGVLNKKHPDIEIGQRTLERHLQVDERGLYDHARGRA